MAIRWILIAVGLSTLVLLPQPTTGQTGSYTSPAPSQLFAKQELNQAALSYRAGDFSEAQAHAEKALAGDPKYRTGLASPENTEIARAAMEA